MPDVTLEDAVKEIQSFRPTEDLISERGTTHGNYDNTARYIQQLKYVIATACVERKRRGQDQLTNQERESLEMIMHKAGRILSGDSHFRDHWDDIAGYAKIATQKEF
jgi:hypothetical protein